MANNLTVPQIAALTKDGEHRVSHGLYLQLRGPSRVWLLRYRYRGRPCRMSLGTDRPALTDAGTDRAKGLLEEAD